MYNIIYIYIIDTYINTHTHSHRYNCTYAQAILSTKFLSQQGYTLTLLPVITPDPSRDAAPRRAQAARKPDFQGHVACR